MTRYSISPQSLSELISSTSEYTSGVLTQVNTSGVVISGITQDSRHVQPGDLYCCVRGERFDGHTFIKDAIAAGAVAVLVDRDIGEVSADVGVVRVDDVRPILGPLSSIVFGHPSTQLIMVGITGTNGKTSTAAMVSSILSHAGHRVDTIGTLSGERTTPEAIDLHAYLRRCVNDGVTHVVMEVSSHALAQARVSGVMFNVAVFTNIGRDHLDFHETEEAYFAAKAKLFDPGQSLHGVVNIDDARGRLLSDVAPVAITPFSLDDVSDVRVAMDEVSFLWNGMQMVVPMGGSFTVMNALAAAVTASYLGVSVADIAKGLRNLAAIPGRFQSIPNDVGVGVIVDYAHTPDGLSQVLQSARSVCDGQVIVVFGCGGDRDQGKRPAMGGTAAELADVVFVTSDNPRSENPATIISEVLAGIPSGAAAAIHEVVDRHDAISSAIFLAKRGDIVVIAGKGHELTQEVNGVHLAFSDVDQAREALAKKGDTSQ